MAFSYILFFRLLLNSSRMKLHIELKHPEYFAHTNQQQALEQLQNKPTIEESKISPPSGQPLSLDAKTNVSKNERSYSVKCYEEYAQLTADAETIAAANATAGDISAVSRDSCERSPSPIKIRLVWNVDAMTKSVS